MGKLFGGGQKAPKAAAPAPIPVAAPAPIAAPVAPTEAATSEIRDPNKRRRGAMNTEALGASGLGSKKSLLGE